MTTCTVSSSGGVKAGGAAASGTITFTLNQPLVDTTGDVVEERKPIVATVTAGSFSVALTATADAQPTGATYKVKVDVGGNDRTFDVEVPAVPTIDWSDLVPVDRARPTNSYALASALADHEAAAPAHAATRISTSGLVGTPATDVGTALAHIAPAAGVGRLVSEVTAIGNSMGLLTVHEAAQRWPRLFAYQMGAVLKDFHVSSKLLLDVGANSTQGGFARAMGLAAPATPYGSRYYGGRRGIVTLFHGINDVESHGADALLNPCYRLVQSAVLSWMQLAAFHQHDAASTGQSSTGTWSGGAWLSGFEEGPGTNRATTTDTGATRTVTTSANAAGRTVALFFVANWSGGSRASSVLSFTLDGQPATPVGWTSTDLRAVAPAAVGHGVCVAARFALPDDAAAHTIVATTGAGGAIYCGYGIEATASRPILVANCPRRAAGASYSGDGSDARVLSLNANAIAPSVAEFGSPVVVVDADAALGQDPDLMDAVGLHAIGPGHDALRDAFRDSLDALILTAAQEAAL